MTFMFLWDLNVLSDLSHSFNTFFRPAGQCQICLRLKDKCCWDPSVNQGCANLQDLASDWGEVELQAPCEHSEGRLNTYTLGLLVVHRSDFG